MTLQTGYQTTILLIFPNISQTKVNQTMKFGQLIEYNKTNIFFRIMQKLRQGDYFQTSFCFFRKVHMRYASGLQLRFNIF